MSQDARFVSTFRERRRGQTFVEHATSLPGSWSEDQAVAHHPEQHFRVRAEQSCERMWKWRLRLRNDSPQPLSFACTLATTERATFRNIDRMVVKPQEEIESVFFLDAQPGSLVFVLFGEMDR